MSSSALRYQAACRARAVCCAAHRRQVGVELGAQSVMLVLLEMGEPVPPQERSQVPELKALAESPRVVASLPRFVIGEPGFDTSHEVFWHRCVAHDHRRRQRGHARRLMSAGRLGEYAFVELLEPSAPAVARGRAEHALGHGGELLLLKGRDAMVGALGQVGPGGEQTVGAVLAVHLVGRHRLST